MASHSSNAAPLRKTRIVCISDTHNQTPKLPPGDVLIHAGDLTNQGSYSELKKTVRWLEQADFEAKIVIAGNHETTLDTPFYNEHKDHWKWPEPQDSARNRALLTDSPSITYLENSHATIYLTSPTGPRTCFKVFGSPCQPNQRRWAFRYSDAATAESIWSKIEDDVDIVVTHTPAEGLLDKPEVRVDFRCGCPALLGRLSHVRPRMHVCGHIHDGRGAGRVRWKQPQPGGNTPIEAVEYWKDPGAGNRKLSLVDVSLKSGRPLLNTGCWTRHAVPDSLEWNQGGQPDASAWDGCQPGKDESKSTSGEDNCGPCVRNEAGKWRRTQGGAIELRMASDVGGSSTENDDQAEDKGRVRNAVDEQRTETVMINAAFLGGRVNGKAKSFNKPIVVDIELPVWDMGHAE